MNARKIENTPVTPFCIIKDVKNKSANDTDSMHSYSSVFSSDDTIEKNDTEIPAKDDVRTISNDDPNVLSIQTANDLNKSNKASKATSEKAMARRTLRANTQKLNLNQALANENRTTRRRTSRPRRPTCIGQYQKGELLGSGSYGNVYKALHINDGG